MYPTPDDLAGPSLPPWFLLPATVLFAVATLYWILTTRGRAARYLIFACWFRYTLSSLHEYTYHEAFAGLRWIAIGTLISIGAGIVVLDKRRFFARPIIPVFLICGVMVISAIVNQTGSEAFDPILRFIFFAITAVALWQALETNGSVILKRLLFVFAQPILYQIASILLGVVKSGELDGSTSYIGGFYHEEVFSLILATCFLVAMFAPRIGRLTRLLLCIISFVGVYLANYRTTMLGIAPIAIVGLMLVVPRAFHRKQRGLIRIAVGIAGAGLIFVGFTLEENRFSDLAAISQGTALIKPPESFTYAEQRVLSSRPYIWSKYLYAYGEAPPVQKIIGFGPDSWQGTFPLYAHNTAVSFLYELGIAGVAAIFLLWFMMLRQALLADGESRPLLIAGHASFFMLNMATMPHWQIEGNIFYGLLCGYTIAKARCAMATRQGTAASISPPPVTEPDVWAEPWPARSQSRSSTA